MASLDENTSPPPSLPDHHDRRADSSDSSLVSSPSSSLSLPTPPPLLYSYSSPTLGSPSILRTASSSSFSTINSKIPNAESFPTSSSSGLSISFAPLPSVEPRRRNTSVQLGVAARARLLRNRRMLRDQQVTQQEEQSEQQEHQQLVLPKPQSQKRVPLWTDDVDYDENDEPISDPALDALVALGRLVRGASKSLWRQLKDKEGKAKNRPTSGQQGTQDARRESADVSANADAGDNGIHDDEKDSMLMDVGPSYTEPLPVAMRGAGMDGAKRAAGRTDKASRIGSRTLSDASRNEERDSPLPPIRRSASLSKISLNDKHVHRTKNAHASGGGRSASTETPDASAHVKTKRSHE